MSIAKTEFKIAMLDNISSNTRDARQRALQEVQQAIGAVAVLKIIQTNLGDILRGASTDIRASNEFSPEQIERVLRYLQRCVDSIVSTSTQLGVQKIRLEGRVQLLEEQIENWKKELAGEQVKLAEQRQPPTPTEDELNSRKPLARVIGMHPGETFKARRLRETAEEHAAKTKAEIVADEQASDAPKKSDAVLDQIDVKSTRKKRTRLPV